MEGEEEEKQARVFQHGDFQTSRSQVKGQLSGLTINFAVMKKATAAPEVNSHATFFQH